MVLEKDSSVLGYPGEISRALDADHHGVCKFDSPGDPQYVAVRNVLRSLISKLPSPGKNLNPRLIIEGSRFKVPVLLEQLREVKISEKLSDLLPCQSRPRLTICFSEIAGHRVLAHGFFKKKRSLNG